MFALRPIPSGERRGQYPVGVERGSERIRVVLVGMPRMLRDIVAGLVAAEGDLELVGDFADSDARLESLEAVQPSVIIAGAQAPLLARRIGRRALVLGVSADGRESVLYELRPRERVLGDVSPSTLLAAVRAGLSAAVEAQGR
jgi:DNA-binding NarL/FixJ family response regulator